MITDKEKDERYVYSACCTWHGPIQEVKVVGGRMSVNGRPFVASIPGCPHCGSPLMEHPNRAAWDESLAKFAAAHPDLTLYREWMDTLRGPCKPLKGWEWRKDYEEFARSRTT